MKYGAHAFIWRDGYGDAELLRMLDDAAAWGLSFFEVAIGDDIHFEAAAIGAAAKVRGLELVFSPGGAWPLECDISLADSRKLHPGVEWHRQAIDFAAQAGATAYTGALYGHPGTVLRHRPCPEEAQRTAERLHELAAYGEQLGITLVLEPMSHFRTHIANTPGQINRLLELADHENLYSLLDTYHLVTEVTDLAAAFTEMRPRLWGLHACENNRGAPGTGMLPWEELFAAIKQTGWQGYIGFESYNSTWRDGEFAFERGMFHNVCRDAEAFSQQSNTFVESGLKTP